MNEEIYCKIGHFGRDVTIQLSNDFMLKFAFSSFSLSFVSICLVLIIFAFLQENAFFSLDYENVVMLYNCVHRLYRTLLLFLTIHKN